MSDPYLFNCTVVKIIDGDTIDVDVDLGFGCWVRGSAGRIRLFGIDCEESRTRDLEEKKRGLIAKEWLINKIDPTSVGSAKEIMLKSYEYGKYGRVIGELFIVSGSRKQSINKMMLAEGLVTEYDGGAR